MTLYSAFTIYRVFQCLANTQTILDNTKYITKIEINNSRKTGKVMQIYFRFSPELFFPVTVSVHAQDAIALEVYVMTVCQTLENAILNKVLRSLELEACSCRSRKTRDDI